MTFLRTFMKSRPPPQKLRQRGILKERVFGCDLGEHLHSSEHEGKLDFHLSRCNLLTGIPIAQKCFLPGCFYTQYLQIVSIFTCFSFVFLCFSTSWFSPCSPAGCEELHWIHREKRSRRWNLQTLGNFIQHSETQVCKQTIAARPHFSGIVGFQALRFNFMFLWIVLGCFTLELDQAPQHWTLLSLLCHAVFPYCHCVDISIFIWTVLTSPCCAWVDGWVGKCIRWPKST